MQRNTDKSAASETEPEKSKLLLSRDEVHARYGLTRRYLEIAAWKGDGPPMIRISRRMVRYRAEDIETWIAAHRVTNTSEVQG